MSNVESKKLEVDVVFQSLIQTSLSFEKVELILIIRDFKPLESSVCLQLTKQIYEEVQAQNLFNLNPEIQTKSVIPFQSDLPIALTISLKPDLLLQLADHQDNLAEYFAQLSTEQPDHPLLFTENWFALRVIQETPDGEIGYRTFWDYVRPDLLFQEDVSSDAIADGLVEFFQSWVENNLPEMTQAALSEVVKDFSQELEDQLSESDLETLTQDAIATIFSELIEGFDRWTKGEPLPKALQTQSLLQTAQAFFQADGWDFRLLNESSTLKLAFQGKYDRWTCYAQISQEQQHFMFYSVVPIKASRQTKGAVAEFIARANYGMAIGNFELDFNDGEIRYKTSIDVEGDRLTPALIKNLVYTNVIMMDEYLPGIKAVIEKGDSPEKAIRAVEQPNTATQWTVLPS